ncbi:MAG: hypothetical protein HC939_00230 [Pleurocapsa sp. SU_5_0]|nr:hypothetical protein [Pleurocapsa sp. SU_5_0]NJO96525.1 hypothetical protein [Pleurocapsa sp. CRU_1_2]NJR44634.1 hypothetical protein [Hyellaceae cyanobacterium CSU_1_1]
MINTIFCLAVVGIAIWIGIKEQKFSSDYQKRDFVVVDKSIKELTAYKQKQKNNFIQAQKESTEIIRWLAQHLKGESTSLAFKPEQDNNGDFILLSYPFILGKPVPRSPVSFAPALLTAIGILGTFTGIFLGLQGIDLGNLSETQQLITASQNLLAGMKTAFVTSLFGMGAAIFFILYLSWGERKRTGIRNKFRKELSNIAFLENPNRLLSRLDNEGNIEVAKTLQSVADNLSGFNADVIANAIKSAIASPDSLFIQELKTLEKIGQLVENTSGLSNLTPNAIASATSDNFTVLINPISEEIKQLRELQESQGQTVESLVKQLRNELIEPVVTRLDQSAELTKEASAAVTDLKNELGGISTSLAGAVQTIQSFQQDTLTRLQEFAANLQSILGQFRTDTQGVMEQVAVEIKEAVNQSITGMEAQRTAFEASASQASQTFRGIREDLQAALNTQAEQQRQMLQDVQTSTESVLVKANEAFLNQSHTLTTVGKEASGLMSEAKDNFLGTLNSIDGMLQNTRLTVQQELEQFRLDYQAALQDFFTQQNNLLNDTLGKQREGLAGVVVNLQQTFSEEATQRKEMTVQVDQSLDRIGETVKTVNTLASAMGMTSSERLGQLQELARTIGNEAHRVEHSYQNMTEQFNEALVTGNEQLNNYLKQANETYTKSIQDADKAAAEVCSKLNETSHGLMNTADFLVTAAKELKNSNGGN